MRTIKEQIEVDLFVDPRPLTLEEQKIISDYISKDRQEQNSTKKRSKSTIKKNYVQSTLRN